MPLYAVCMETTILLNIATFKVFPLADMKGRSLLIINIILVDTCTLFSMPENDWKYHFLLLLVVSCMFCYQIPTHTARPNMIPPQDCPKTFTTNLLGLCRVCYDKKWRAISCLDGISTNDHVFQHGPWTGVRLFHWCFDRSTNLRANTVIRSQRYHF